MGNTEAKEQPLQEPHSIPKSPRVLSSAPEFTAVSPVHTRLDLIHHQSNPSLIQIKGESYNQPPTPSDMSPSARLMPERTQLHIKKPSNLGIKIRNLSPEAIGQGYFSPPKNSPRLQPLSTRNIQSTNSARAKNGQILHGRISGLGGRTGSIEKKNEALYRDQVKFDIPKTLEYGDSDQVIYQGTLLKYKPGMHSLWIERWCVVTKKCFKYYKAEWVAKCPDLKPLSIIPIVDIVACRAISLEVQDGPSKKNFLKSDQQSYNELFQFEIFNKNGDFPYQDELGGCQSVQKSDEKDCEGLRLWANYEEKRRSDRHSPLKIKKDQLMRSPVRSRDPRTARNSQGNDIVDRDSDRSFSGSPPPIQSTIRESVKLSGKKNGDEENLAIKKSTHKWKKDKSDLTSWSGRAREWYFSEKRLLFAVPKAEDRDKWVTVMNQVIHGDSLGER